MPHKNDLAVFYSMPSSRAIFFIDQLAGADWHGIEFVGATDLDLFLALSFEGNDRIVI